MGKNRSPIFVSNEAHAKLVHKAYEQRTTIKEVVDVLLGIKESPQESTALWWERHPNYRTTVDVLDEELAT